MKLREEAEERYGVAGEDGEGLQEPQPFLGVFAPRPHLLAQLKTEEWPHDIAIVPLF